MNDNQTTISELQKIVMKHVTERHWDKNSPRGLAVSILLEASELLEHYQWSDQAVGNQKELAEELADIFIYMLQFSAQHTIDLSKAVVSKLEKSAKKYPLEQFSTTDEATRQAAWLNAKKNFKKDTIL